jgi:hypothetical protein
MAEPRAFWYDRRLLDTLRYIENLERENPVRQDMLGLMRSVAARIRPWTVLLEHIESYELALDVWTTFCELQRTNRLENGDSDDCEVLGVSAQTIMDHPRSAESVGAIAGDEDVEGAEFWDGVWNMFGEDGAPDTCSGSAPAGGAVV